MKDNQEVEFLDQIAPPESYRYGGKASGLVSLISHGFYVPRGFAIACDCFQELLTLNPRITKTLKNIDAAVDPDPILQGAEEMQEILQEYTLPERLQLETRKAFTRLHSRSEHERGYAVRSSANIEDSDTSSFAGQATTTLCVSDLDAVLSSIKKTWFSLFSLEALLYMKTKKIPLNDVRMGVVVQEMVDADTSGVMFTADVVQSEPDKILIDSTWGLGEPLVSGRITPDSFVVQKDPLEILQKRLGSKKLIAIQTTGSESVGYSLSETPIEKREKLSLSDEQVLRISKTGIEVERRLKRPQDIEWCLEGENLLLLQARPITTLDRET
jgi:pyruvate,water dikinase